jgi:hypothetical protein
VGANTKILHITASVALRTHFGIVYTPYNDWSSGELERASSLQPEIYPLLHQVGENGYGLWIMLQTGEAGLNHTIIFHAVQLRFWVIVAWLHVGLLKARLLKYYKLCFGQSH